MKRRRKVRRLQTALDRIETVMQRGFYVQKFSDIHWRIQDRIDFWPTTGRWSDRSASLTSVYRNARENGGYEGLLIYLERSDLWT